MTEEAPEYQVDTEGGMNIVGCIHDAWFGYSEDQKHIGLFVAIRQHNTLVGIVGAGCEAVDLAVKGGSAENIAESVDRAKQVLDDAGKKRVDDLKGVPVSVTLSEGMEILEWRILTEAL